MNVKPSKRTTPFYIGKGVRGVMVWLVCLLLGYAQVPAENTTVTLSPSLRIQEVTVSGNDTSKWPEGDWYPVPLKEYQSLKHAALLKKNTPPNSWIQEASYSATLKGDQLVDGQLEYVLHCSRNEPGFINLSKLNLAIHDLTWESQEAVWGLAPDQRTMLLVDHFDERLRGNWSLKGRQLPQRTEFTFHLPETVVSRVQLQLPQGMVLTTSVGYVSGPMKSDLPGYESWQIELGGQSEFQAVIYQSERGKRSPTQILYHQFAQVAIREDGLRLREDFQIEVLNQAVQKLQFESPAEYEIYSVTLGNDLALPFEVQQANGQNLITVDLIDPLLGIGRPLSIRALASPSLEGDVVVPRLKFRQAHFLGGTVHLDISAPLQTHKITATDLRQTGVLIQEEQGEAYDFKQYTPNARLQYELALPDLNLSARVHTLIQVDDKVWNLNTRIHWASAAGTTYRLETMIPAGWEITQVKSLTADKNLGDLVWDVEQSNRQQKLSVRLPISVSPETPYSLEIQARRLFPDLKRPFDLFGIKPVGCDNVNRILEIVTSETEAGLQFEPDKEVEELIPSELPKNWEFPASGTNILGFYRLAPYSGSRWGTLTLSRTEPALQIATRTFIGIKDDEVQENYLLNCEPVRGGMKRVLVYLSDSGAPVEWELSSDRRNQARLSSKKLPNSEHEKWNLPQQGELWELTFSSPVFSEVELHGSRSRPFQKKMRVTLAYAPQAVPFEGIIRVLNSNELNLRIQTEGLTPTSESSSSTRLKRVQRNYEWAYSSPADTLNITRASELSDTDLEHGTATILVETMFGHGNGEPDVHQATIDLDLSKSFDDKVLLRFPAEVKLISTAVNQQRVTPIETGSHYLVPLFDQLDNYKITIQYQTVAVAEGLATSRRIPFPQIDQRVLETDWNFTLPEGEQLITGPEDMVLQQVIPEGTITRRMFGVLGKGKGDELSQASGWNAVVLFPMKFGTLRTSNLKRANIISWIVLLSTIILGVLLRIFRIGIREKLSVVLVLISLALAWIFPFPLAQIAGSCFTGIMIATLIPRRFLRQEIMKQIEDQSTKAYEQPLTSINSVARLLLLGCLMTSAVDSYAQNVPAPSNLPKANQSKTLKTELVLLPDHAGKTGESFAYLTPALLQELEALTTQDPQPAYLISSAQYDGTIQDNQLLTVRARFDIKVPAEIERATIQLPVSGGNLSGPDSCRVNGKVVPVLLGSDGQGIVVNIQNEKMPRDNSPVDDTAPVEAQKPVLPFTYTSYRIELVLHPAVKFSATGGEFELGIPTVAINEFSFQCDEPLFLVELTETTGVSRYQLAGSKQFRSFLKENPVLKVKWLTSQNSESTPLSVEAAAVANVEVSPSLLRTEMRVKYKVLSGKVDYLFWKLPPGMILRSVKSSGISVVTAIEPKENGAYQELLLELSESKTGEFEIDAAFDLPSSDPLMSLKIMPIDIGGGTQNSSSKSIKVTSYQLGVRTGPEFELQQSGTLPEGVLSISSKTTAKPLDPGVLKSSAMMFQVNQVAPVSLILKSKNPKRSARISQTIVVNRKNIDWTFLAELRISEAPAFRHIITVPQGLRIESLSVKEEDVERLAHWHRIGNQITLFLKNKTTGLQDLTLKGWLPIRKLGNLKFPAIQLEGVEIEESLLSLYRKPQISVQLVSPHYQRTQNGTSQAAVADHISFVGRFRETNSENQPISLVVNLQKSSITVDTLTVIEAVEAQEIEVAQSLRFVLPASVTKNILLLIPTEYGTGFFIDGMPFEDQGQQADGFHRVELQPTPSTAKESSVTVRAKIPKPTGEFAIPAVKLDNSLLQNNYLLLSNSQNYQLADKKERQPLLPENIPAWVKARCEASDDLDFSRVYSTLELPWKMVTTSRAASALNREFIPFLETEVILSDQGTVYGLTQIKLFRQNSRELTLNWPEKSKLMAVLINGENDSSLKPESGQLSIPVNGSTQFNEITLFWETFQIEHRYFLEKAAITVPLPVNIPFDKNLLKIITADGHRTYLSDNVSAFTYCTGKLEEQLKIAELELEWGDENQVSRKTWTDIAKEFTQLELILAEPTEMGGRENEELKRFNELRQRVFSIRNNVKPPAESEAELHSFVHEFQQKLGPLPVQKIRYYSSSETTDQNSVTLIAWIVPNLYLNVVLACFALLILLPVLGRCVQPRSADWLSSRPALGLLILGLIWTLCLTPTACGLIFITLAAIVEFKQRQSLTADLNRTVTGSPGAPSVNE